MNRLALLTLPALLVGCMPAPPDSALLMEGRLPTVGRFADAYPMIEIDDYEEFSSVRFDHLGAGWAMTRVALSDAVVASARDGVVELDGTQGVGCSGPSMGDWWFDEPPTEIEVEVQLQPDGSETLVVDHDFGFSGYVVTRIPTDLL